MNTKRRPTMADVAYEAGVSAQTVSRAINNKSEISEVTKNKILEIADRMGFRPSAIARSLATRRTATIGLVVTDITNPFFSGIASGVENIAYSNSFNIFLCNTGENVAREQSAINSLLEKQVDGLILCSSRLNQDDLVGLLNNFSYVVLINRNFENRKSGIVTITIDDVLGAEMAVNYFISRGHKKIAFLVGPKRSWGGKNLLQGFQTGLSNHGIELDPKLVFFCEPNTQCGFEITSQFLNNIDDVTAIFTFNDLIAVGALQACQKLNRRVPDEIAIIGYDDIPLASQVTPSLSTIRIPTQEIGGTAMRTLIAMIEGETLMSPNITFKPELILRDSAP